MDHLPLELWQEIGKYACTDGGYTGCSLSAVSHAMRSAMHLVRYNSVAITNAESCLAFVALISHIDPASPIRHLFISYSAIPFCVTIQQIGSLHDSYDQILSRAAPTLVTLVIHEPSDTNAVLANFLRFPVLRDLSVPDFLRVQQNSRPLSEIIPSVERLHISACTSNHHLDFWDNLALLTPSLTRIRISHICDRSIPGLLRTFLDAPITQDSIERDYDQWEREYTPDSPSATRVRSAAAQLPSLVHIIAQPERHPWANEPVEIALQSIAEDTAGRTAGERRLHYLAASEEYTFEEAIADWRQLMAGGDGPWLLPT